MLDEVMTQNPLHHKALWGGTPWEHEKYAHGNLIPVYRGVPLNEGPERDAENVGRHWTTSKHVATRFARFGDIHTNPVGNSKDFYDDQTYHRDRLEGEDPDFEGPVRSTGKVLMGLVHESDTWKFNDPLAKTEFTLAGAYHPDSPESAELKAEKEVLLKKGAPILAIGHSGHTFNPEKPGATGETQMWDVNRERTAPFKRKFYRA